MMNFCPKGFKQLKNFNGMEFCQECSISNCNECVDVAVQVQNTSDTQNPYVNKTIEMCLECQGSYFLDPFKTQCISIIEWLSINNPQPQQPVQNSIRLDYIIESRNEIYPQNIT